MAEPTTTTTLTVTAGLGLASISPFINGDALLGAVLGAVLLVNTQKELKALQRILSLFLSIGVGYLLAPEVNARTLITSPATGAFLCAIFAIPFVLKLMVWFDKSGLAVIIDNLIEFLKKLRGGSS